MTSFRTVAEIFSKSLSYCVTFDSHCRTEPQSYRQKLKEDDVVLKRQAQVTSVISSLACWSLSGLLAHNNLASTSLFFCSMFRPSCQRCHDFILWSKHAWHTNKTLSFDHHFIFTFALNVCDLNFRKSTKYVCVCVCTLTAPRSRI